MRVSFAALAGALLLAGCATTAQAAWVLQPLAGFGASAPGWLAPADATFLTENHTERGLAYNPANNQLYLVDRGGGAVRVLDGDTGALITSLDMTDVTGGFFAMNMIGAADDGAIYMGNLTIAADVEFKIYRWADEAATPTVAFEGLTGLARLGDGFAVIGSGDETRIIASGSGHAAIAVFDSTDGANFSMTSASTISDIRSGGFRLGLDFIDANTAVGQQSGFAELNVADLAASTGVVFETNVTGEAPLAYYGPSQLLATVAVDSSDVRLYDASDLSLLTSTGFQDLANNTVGMLAANTNGTGDLAFGRGPDGGLRLYVLSTNHGIQAFQVIPEPSSLALLLVLAAILAGLAPGRRW